MYSHANSKCPHQRQQWDPESLIGLTNPQTGDFSCVGYARTRHRRCQGRVARHKVSLAQGIIDKLADQDPFVAAASTRLWDVANIMLCWQHTNQAAEVVAGWKTRLFLVGLAARIRDHHQAEPKAEPTDESFDDQKRSRKPDDIKERPRPTEQQKRYQEPRPSWEDRDTRAREEERARQKERQRQEKERLDREAEARKEKLEREAAARRKKQKQDRETARKQWAQAWQRYDAQWQAIEASRGQTHYTQIPWPTKSGKREDVNRANVREFFRNAPPVSLASEPEEEMFCIMSKENKRWHTDKILCRFGRDVLQSPCKDALDVLSKLIIELWKEAKMQRTV